ncbi:xanthine dehydrogenase family protein molybdopterin-binding subunit [Rhodoflexus caldus]|uniref:xanthine dehydrogenase family protein molybdopterin-binding subunit n=1 Tax=Rhodoflexus caldus TaxID=2891236 RepID=UPI00202A7631|nr:xanthine dehydrogenase family protein molybdopterin-binding subunit [Rhodoflexus caldus]
MQKLPRRDFLKTTGLAGSALALGFVFADKKAVLAKVADSGSSEITPFISIEPSGKITLINPRPDMGQGTFHTIPSLIAEELEVEMSQITVIPSDGNRKYGGQLSGGSGSVRASWKPMREAGAAARQMLTQAAAQRWKVPAEECYAANGEIHHRPTQRRLSYGELSADAARLDVPKNPALKPAKDFRIIGKSVPRIDVPAKTNGTAIFGMDAKVPGMLYASVAMPPAIWGKAVTIDDRRAKAVKGVKQIVRVKRPIFSKASEGVAVIADNYFAAVQGRKALNITWEKMPHSTFQQQAYFEKMRALAKQPYGIAHEHIGDVKPVFANAENKIIEAVYETPFAAHAAMEPLVALAHVKEDGSCELWAPVQSPDGAIGDVARELGIAPDKVKIHVLFMGGAFGRKAFYDFVVQAALLSKEVKAPVKLIWTREDDMTQGPFRPAMVNKLRAAIDPQGNVTALQHTVIGGSIQNQWGGLKADKADDWAMEAIDRENSPYEIPNFLLDYHHAETTVPLLWWRSVYSSTNAFGHESFIDELAHAAKKDPLEFRLQLMHKHERFRIALETLREKAEWNKPLPQGKARGVAIVRSFNTICATAVFISKNAEGAIQIDRVVSVLDCGIAVNPDNVRAQTEGNVVMALSTAVKDAITFENGQAKQQNYNSYRPLRINEVPEIEVHIVANNHEPSGVGEPGLPPVAPALCNAIFALTGKRIRTLPFSLAV